MGDVIQMQRLPEVLPCPFCGSRDIESEDTETSDYLFMSCDNCGASGPAVNCSTDDVRIINKATAEALELWNKRAKPIW